MWELDQPVFMWFVDLEEAFNSVPQAVLWGVLQECEVSSGPLLWVIQVLYNRSKSLVHITGNKSYSVLVGVRLCQGFVTDSVPNFYGQNIYS